MALEGVPPTGFVDPMGKIPLTAISTSTLLKKVVSEGGWTIIRPPNAKIAGRALKVLDNGRDKPGWDLACGLLRAQLVAELDGAPTELTRREVANTELHLSAGSALSITLLRAISKNKSKSVITFPNPLPHNVDSRWQGWHGRNNSEMAQQTLIAFYCHVFGTPRMSILDAAQAFSDPRVLESVGANLEANWSTFQMNPGMKRSDQRKPAAIRTPELDRIIQVYLPFADRNPDRWAAASVAFQLCMDANDGRRAIKYGRRYLALAPKDHTYRSLVADQMRDLEKKFATKPA